MYSLYFLKNAWIILHLDSKMWKLARKQNKVQMKLSSTLCICIYFHRDSNLIRDIVEIRRCIRIYFDSIIMLNCSTWKLGFTLSSKRCRKTLPLAEGKDSWNFSRSVPWIRSEIYSWNRILLHSRRQSCICNTPTLSVKIPSPFHVVRFISMSLTACTFYNKHGVVSCLHWILPDPFAHDSAHSQRWRVLSAPTVVHYCDLSSNLCVSLYRNPFYIRVKRLIMRHNSNVRSKAAKFDDSDQVLSNRSAIMLF